MAAEAGLVAITVKRVSTMIIATTDDSANCCSKPPFEPKDLGQCPPDGRGGLKNAPRPLFSEIIQETHSEGGHAWNPLLLKKAHLKIAKWEPW